MNYRQLALWLPLVMVLTTYTFYEVGRFMAKKQLCHDNYLIHHNFTQESVCGNHAYSASFQAMKLTDCEKANKHVVEETPLLCGLRNWFMTSWFVRAWNLGTQGLGTLWTMVYTFYERSTNVVMVVLVLPLCIVATIYFYIQDKGATTRLAITQETQNVPMEILARAMDRQSILVNNQPPSQAAKILKRTKGQSRIVRGEIPQDF